MNDVVAKIEALLFVAPKPMTTRQLATALSVQISDVDSALLELATARNIDHSGIHLVIGDEGIMLATNPVFADVVARLAKEDVEPELTRPSLETLTIIAYRGPITKPEIELIRGVNCTLILRNLLMRGLIVEEEDTIKLQPVYTISHDTLRSFGLHGVNELPEYDALHTSGKIDSLLATSVSTSLV